MAMPTKYVKGSLTRGCPREYRRAGPWLAGPRYGQGLNTPPHLTVFNWPSPRVMRRIETDFGVIELAEETRQRDDMQAERVRLDEARSFHACPHTTRQRTSIRCWPISHVGPREHCGGLGHGFAARAKGLLVSR
jgi:hypothetical protein